MILVAAPRLKISKSTVFISSTQQTAHTNGFRPRFFLQAEREHPTEGAIKRIRVDNITCNGTSGTAFFIGQNVEGPITLASRDITNIAANAPSSVYDAAISAQSNGLVVEGGGRLSLAKTTTVPIKTAAGKTIAAQRDERFIGDLSANRTIQWVPPVKCQITGILLVVDAAFSASNSPDLWTMTFRGSDGNALTVKNTLPGDGDEISPLIAGVPKRVAAGTYQALNAVFSLGQSMKVDFAKAGNAPTFVGLRMIVEYVPLAS